MPRTKSTKPIDQLVASAVRARTYADLGASQPGQTEPERVANKWSVGMSRHFRRRFAEQLNALRLNARLSFQELGRCAEVDHSQLVRLEAGERTCTIETAVKIAGALGVILGILIDE